MNQYTIKIIDSNYDNYGQYDSYYSIETEKTERDIRAHFNNIKERMLVDCGEGLTSSVTNGEILEEMLEEGILKSWDSYNPIDFTLTN